MLCAGDQDNATDQHPGVADSSTRKTSTELRETYTDLTTSSEHVFGEQIGLGPKRRQVRTRHGESGHGGRSRGATLTTGLGVAHRGQRGQHATLFGDSTGDSSGDPHCRRTGCSLGANMARALPRVVASFWRRIRERRRVNSVKVREEERERQRERGRESERAKRGEQPPRSRTSSSRTRGGWFARRHWPRSHRGRFRRVKNRAHPSATVQLR